MADTTVYIPIAILIFVGIITTFVAIISQRKNRPAPPQSTSRYSSRRHQTYVPGQFSSQMELDLRLPYRRFRQLYPGSNLTYDQYKRLQMQRAFRRSMSSQENKRMVR